MFQGSHFLQVQGVALETCCAPSYANLYLGEWECDSMTPEDLSQFSRHNNLWYRYIDDILVWDSLEELLWQYISVLNMNNFNLNFYVLQSKIDFWM